MSYFKGDDLLFTLSKRQRDFLASPPDVATQSLDRHAVRTATILARNGLIISAARASDTSSSRSAIRLTPAGEAALAFYDTLKRLEGSRGA